METIIIATDLGEMTKEVVKAGLELAGKTGAKAILTVIINKNLDYFPPDTGMIFSDQWEARRYLAQTALDNIKEKNPAADIEVWVDIGVPQKDIIETAIERKASMIVIGTHGRGALAHMLMGGTAEYIVRHSPVPVLVVPFNKNRH
jgi:nucleotide-binding universal stress UspA family protein